MTISNSELLIIVVMVVQKIKGNSVYNLVVNDIVIVNNAELLIIIILI
jgi:hypothetical protein